MKQHMRSLVLGLVMLAVLGIAVLAQADGTETPPIAGVTATAGLSATETSPQPATPSASPSPAVAPAPSAPASTLTGWPGPDNTGVPKGTVLKRSGSIRVTQSDTVIEGLEIHGCIQIDAARVVIRNTRVIGSCDRGSIGMPLGDAYGVSNVLIEDVEVDGNNETINRALLAYSGFTCRRCNLHNGGTGARLGSRVLIIDSWIHDENGGGDSHNAAIAGHSSDHVTLIHNRMSCYNFDHCSSALSLYSEGDPVHDVLVERNHFSGGGYCVYGGVTMKGAVNIRFHDNAFGRTPMPKCGEYGPYVHWDPGPGNEWTGNYWDDADKTPLRGP